MHLSFLLKWYNKILIWSKHPNAAYYLAFVSFIDASIFPLSPLLMVLPMSLAAPKKAFHYAAIVIISSFFGGIIGYSLGYYALDSFIKPFLQWMGYEPYFQMIVHWFQRWGYFAILFGGLTPFIPYKIITIGSGIMQLNFSGFLIASFFGRTLRFLLIATIIKWGGPRFEPFIRKSLAKLA